MLRLEHWLLLVALGDAAPGPQQPQAPRARSAPARTPRACQLGEYAAGAACVRRAAVCGDGGGGAACEHVLCESGVSEELLRSSHQQVRQLNLVDWPGACLNVSALQYHFPALLSLELHRSATLKTFKGHFAPHCTIERIVMHELRAMTELLPPGLVSQMQNLRELDLRSNGLRHLRARTVRQPPRLTTVYLADNVWDCSDGGLDWLAMEGSNGSAHHRIADFLLLKCHQRLHYGKPMHKVMEFIRTIALTCPEPCACNMTNVVTAPDFQGGSVMPIITVDCASRHLRAPPPTLPPGTSTLRLQGNQIDTVSVMVQNPHYRRVYDVYLDNNTITSIKELEGSEWLTTFRVLSLRGNTLTQVPTYALDNAFQRNPNMLQVYLGDNPWRCDCTYTPKFQAFILKFQSVIQDVADIRCAKSDDKDVLMVQISSISIAELCGDSDTLFMRPLNVLNVVLASLIVLVLGRFFYDCYSFKSTGKLPWISSILP